MRDIKFRAWYDDSETCGKFEPQKEMFFVGDKHGTTHDLDCVKYKMEGQPVTLMQYTGLKDINGVEIYEGDIVSDHNGVGEVKHSNKHAAYRVVYCNGMAKWFIDYILKGEKESIKVIGNKYENPELLEQLR